MILLADENLDQTVVEWLRKQGHEVLAVAEMQPGIDDSTVLALANEHHALLVTGDKDFGELAFRQDLVHEGVILLRLAGLPTQTKARIAALTLSEHGEEMRNAFTVISPGTLRIRRRET